MQMNPRRTWILSGLLGLALALPLWAPAQAAEEPKDPDAKPKAEEPKEEPKEEPEEEPDPFVVPDGTPEELLEYVAKLQKLRPENIRTRAQFIEFMVKGRKSMLEAADKILAAKPTDEQYTKAAELKLSALEMLSQVNAPDSAKKLAEFVEELTKAGKKELARSGKGVILLSQARMPRDPEAAKKFLEEVNVFLAEGPITRKEANLMMTVARSAEYGGDAKAAAEAYKGFAKLAADSKDEAVSQLAERFAAAGRRMDLPGNPIKVEGFTLDGKEFDWEKFSKDKVVLIDFWATWCGWCIKEIPEMKKLYAAYNPRGFEIVGISGDRGREPLDKFLEKTEIPWTILYGEKGPSHTIAYYGISGFPTMLLVGKDGSVVSLRARGEELRKQLTALLGPMEEEKPEEKEKPEAKEKKDTEVPA